MIFFFFLEMVGESWLQYYVKTISDFQTHVYTSSLFPWFIYKF